MTPFVVGIPTLNRYDCLVKCIAKLFAGTAKPQTVYIIDNGRKLTHGHLEQFDGMPIHVVVPQMNLGVSRSWNLLHRLTRPTMLLLVNDDVGVGNNTLQVLVEQHAGPCIATALGWSCFRHDHEVWDTLGDYDEFLVPAYLEDNDMDWRRHISGTHREICENTTDPIEHSPSSTLAGMTPAERQQLHSMHGINCAYYRLKWGGMPKNANDPNSGERFTKPFNGASEEAIAEMIRGLHAPEKMGFSRILVGGQR
jgi:hypothetical protein